MDRNNGPGTQPTASSQNWQTWPSHPSQSPQSQPPPQAQPPRDSRDAERYQSARKAAQARALVDPLGAKGYRQPRARIGRETRAKRWVFGASVGAFILSLGAIMGIGQRGNAEADANTTGDGTGGSAIAFATQPVTAVPSTVAVPTQPASPTPVPTVASSITPGLFTTSSDDEDDDDDESGESENEDESWTADDDAAFSALFPSSTPTAEPSASAFQAQPTQPALVQQQPQQPSVSTHKSR